MKRNSESGVALLSAILVLMLMSALLVGFIAMVNADQRRAASTATRRRPTPPRTPASRS